jgi:hypothetical protein
MRRLLLTFVCGALVACGQSAPAGGTGDEAANSLSELPLERGFYVMSDTACGNASNATLLLIRADGMNGARTSCDFKSIEQTRATSYRAAVVCNDILFDFAKATIRPDGAAQLDELGRILLSSAIADYRIGIYGHTDAAGSAELNLRLSQERATAVRDYLVERFKTPAARFDAEGFGKEQLKFAAGPLDEANRQKSAAWSSLEDFEGVIATDLQPLEDMSRKALHHAQASVRPDVTRSCAHRDRGGRD